MENPPQLPENNPHERAMLILGMVQELRQSKAFAWFLAQFEHKRQEEKENALSETRKGRKRARHRQQAFTEVLEFLDDQAASNRSYLTE